MFSHNSHAKIGVSAAVLISTVIVVLEVVALLLHPGVRDVSPLAWWFVLIHAIFSVVSMLSMGGLTMTGINLVDLMNRGLVRDKGAHVLVYSVGVALANIVSFIICCILLSHVRKALPTLWEVVIWILCVSSAYACLMIAMSLVRPRRHLTVEDGDIPFARV
eukprot:GILK01012420.1.p1 GENE.GILK01012420.1~~GILK01012420.1.p1  ORF type:complete len:162 (+),score=11.74 GILK01012420.1:230-715(+)